MKSGDIIFLSASVPDRPPWTEGAKPAEIEEAIISVARAVFAREGRLLFGGHPSISPLIAAVAGEYFAADPARIVRPVVTFQSEFFRASLPDETWEMVRMGWSTIEWTQKVAGGGERSDRDASLHAMRTQMLFGPGTPETTIHRNKLKPPRAMIAVGGMDGVRDETVMFLRCAAEWDGARRVYMFKSSGGAVARLLDPATWRARLWPEQRPDERDLETLQQAWQRADVVDVEARWWEENGKNLPRVEYQPFAAMAQWLLDTWASAKQ